MNQPAAAGSKGTRLGLLVATTLVTAWSGHPGVIQHQVNLVGSPHRPEVRWRTPVCVFPAITEAEPVPAPFPI